MSSPAVQLSFTLRTSSNVRTVHLLGSWDNYKNQLPLSAVKDASAKPGSWKGTFRFQGSHALKLGSRYWYYYIIDGYHVSHDPAKESVTEKTTGRKLNILDVPGGKGGKSEGPSVKTSDPPSSKRFSREVPQGRALSPGKIQHPKPQKPYASRGLREADYEESPIDDLEERFAGTRISERSRNYSSSPSELSESSESSGTVFSSSSSSRSPSSESDGQVCRCNRVGVTRDGRRVKLDCGGKVCGYAESSSSSECTSDDDSEDDRRERMRRDAKAEMERAKKNSRSVPEPKRREVVVEKRRR